MDIMDAILKRRSIRQYTGEPVSEEQIRHIIRAASHAPSAHNRQPWRFVVVRDHDILTQFAEVHPYAGMVVEAGTGIVVCGDTEIQDERGFVVEDCSAAIQNMLLAAYGIGLGTVWCGIYSVKRLTDAVSGFLSLPPHILPIGLVVVGHGAEERSVKDRFDESKVHWNSW